MNERSGEFISNVEVRRYQTSDYEQLRRNLQSAGFLSSTDTRIILDMRMHKNPDAILIAAIGDQVVGSVYLGKTEEGANLTSFVVRNGYRGQGIGTKLLSEAERISKNKGVNYIYLISSRGAERFYLRNGYVKIGAEMSKNL